MDSHSLERWKPFESSLKMNELAWKKLRTLACVRASLCSNGELESEAAEQNLCGGILGLEMDRI